MELNTLLLGLGIFIARICDVSIGTVRTIVTVQGRTTIAFFLGFFELIIWISVASTVVLQINESPLLIIFYALGFATGNVVGILVERKLALGSIILRVITAKNGKEIAATLREKGQAVTTFTGEGMKGPVTELYIACRRRDLKWLLPKVWELDVNAFYVTEQVGSVSKILRPVNQPLTGWRAIFKKK